MATARVARWAPRQQFGLNTIALNKSPLGQAQDHHQSGLPGRLVERVGCVPVRMISMRPGADLDACSRSLNSGLCSPPPPNPTHSWSSKGRIADGPPRARAREPPSAFEEHRTQNCQHCSTATYWCPEGDWRLRDGQVAPEVNSTRLLLPLRAFGLETILVTGPARTRVPGSRSPGHAHPCVSSSLILPLLGPLLKDKKGHVSKRGFFQCRVVARQILRRLQSHDHMAPLAPPSLILFSVLPSSQATMHLVCVYFPPLRCHLSLVVP